MKAQRRYLLSATAATMLGVALLGGCSSSPPMPQTTATAYLAAWARQDWTAMRQLTSDPPADFTSVNQAAFGNLTVRQASFAAGPVHTNNSAASAPVTERLTLAGLGTVTIKSALELVLVRGKWLVKWSPATIAPRLGAGDRLSLRTTWPARAAILGADGTPLTSQGQVVTIGIEGALVKNAASLRAALLAAGAPAYAVSTAITAARTHPTFFEPVFTVTRARYDQLKPAIYPIPGTVFQSSTALLAVTPGLTTGVVGTVGPVTAQELSQLGAPYTAQDDVGQTGLEQADERQLAGTPGATAAAAMFGLGKGLHIGLTAFGGSVPQPADQADLAATSIGQGRVLVSPLGLAMVAAATDTGTVRAPRLVTAGAGSQGAALPGVSLPGNSTTGRCRPRWSATCTR